MESQSTDSPEILQYQPPVEPKEPSYKFEVMVFFSVIMLLVLGGMVLLVISIVEFIRT